MASAAIIAALSAMAWAVHRASDVLPPTGVAHLDMIEDTVLASGSIAPVKLVSVGAQASGRILALHVALGDVVKKGQLVAEIDPSTEKNALAIAQAALEQARAQREAQRATLQQADLAYKRVEITYPAEASSEADFEAARAAFDTAKANVTVLGAQIRSAEVGVDAARVILEFTQVTAPINGTVVAIVAAEGQTVNAVQSAPTVVKIADLSTMTVKAQISEADITRVHPGQKVYFTTLANPNHRYEAILRAVEPAPESLAAETKAGAEGAAGGGSAQSAAVYYNGLFDIPNSDGTLRPSMTAEVHIVLASKSDALVVPSSAVSSAGDSKRTVQVLSADGHASTRAVTIGIDNHVNVEILSGLRPGERVVLARIL